jgi:hypothetical protein
MVAWRFFPEVKTEGDNKHCIDYAIESATDLAMPIEKRFVLERVAGNIVRPTRSF